MSSSKVKSHSDLVGQRPPQMVVRQDRFNSDGKLTLQIKNQSYEVVNYSYFGVAIKSTLELSLEEIIEEATLLLFDSPIGEFSLIVRRKEKSENGWMYGFEVITDAIPIDKIHKYKEINDSLAKISDQEERNSGLPTDFKYKILALSGRLQAVEKVAKSFEVRNYSNKADRDTSWDLVISKLGEYIYQDLRQTNFQLQKIIEHQGEDLLKAGFQYFRDILGEYIFQSPFTRRSFEKPRGYAGDFEMMNQIYREDSYAESLFGSCMEKAVHLHEEPTAVRNRSFYLANKIASFVLSSDGPINILSVAAGPAREVALAIKDLSQEELNKITFWLLDQDEDALKYAQKSIRTAALEAGKNIQIHLLNQGIKQVIIEGLKDRQFDFIYSAGLFDYFSDPVAIRAGKSLALSLAPNGKLIIGNFNITSPNWFGMLSLFDWHLILRGESDLVRMFSLDKFKLSIESEPENVNLFCVLERA